MPGKQQSPENPRHDASYKNFFTHPRTIADTLRAAAGDIVRHLDFATLERMPASFVTRTLDLGPGGEYPFVLPIVIYNGERRWTAARDVADLLPPVPEELLGYQPRQRYLLIEIRAQNPASLPLDNVLAMIARFEQAPTAQALEELAGSLGDWLDATGEPELAGAFVAWITHVLAQRFGPAGRTLQRKLRNEEEGTMTTLIERARKWGEERDQLWLQKGFEKGFEKGIEKGLEKGLERERELVHRQVTRRFGPGTAERLLPVLERISEQEDIARVADAVVECESAEEFLRRVREG